MQIRLDEKHTFKVLRIVGYAEYLTAYQITKIQIKWSFLKPLLNQLYSFHLWKYMNGNKQGYTWCNGANIRASRMDYILKSNTFCYACENIRIQNVPGSHSNGTRMSDHKCLFFFSNYK